MVNNQSSDEEMSYTGSNGSFLDSEEDYEYQPTNKRLRHQNVSERNIQRKPTRVPNLKIQNRNALLARENRKRKKEMMETMEKTVEDVQQQNKKLHKMLKLKDSRILKLEQEVRYLKAVITNKTEIVSVLKSLPQFPANKQSEIKVEHQKLKDEIASCSGASSETASCKGFNDNNGTVTAMDPFLPSIFDDFIFTDLEIATEWDEILANPFNSATNFSDIPKLEDVDILSPASSPTSGISTEHNYYEKHIENAPAGGAGVCVHINSGRVSLEFCSTCHYNATTAWVESN